MNRSRSKASPHSSRKANDDHFKSARNDVNEKKRRPSPLQKRYCRPMLYLLAVSIIVSISFLLTGTSTSAPQQHSHQHSHLPDNEKIDQRRDYRPRVNRPGTRGDLLSVTQKGALRGGTTTNNAGDDNSQHQKSQEQQHHHHHQQRQRQQLEQEQEEKEEQQQEQPAENIPEKTQKMEEKSAQTWNKSSRLLMHVGPHKTATTTIQSGLQAHQNSLQEDNYYYIGKLDEEFDVFRPIFQSCFPYDSKDDPCHKRHEWRDFVEKMQQHCNAGHNVILSSEEMSNFPQKEEHWDILKNEAFACFDSVEVVLTYRRYHEWILSYYNNMFRPREYNQYTKAWPGQYREVKTPLGTIEKVGGVFIPTFEEYMENPSKYEHLQNHDYFCDVHSHPLECTKRHFEPHFDTISVFNLHERTEEDGNNVLSNFVCNFMSNATNACGVIRDTEDKNVTIRNEAIDMDAQLIADFVYQKGLIKDDMLLTTKRGEITNLIESVYWDEEEGEVENDVNCLNSLDLKMLHKRSLRAEKRLFPEFYDSPHGKTELNASFERYNEEDLYCSLDIESVFEGDYTQKWHFLKQQQKQEASNSNDEVS